MKKLRFISFLLLFALALPGGALAAAEPAVPEAVSASPVAINAAEMFTDRDRRTAYDAPDTITLSDSGVKTASQNVTVDGGVVTITGEGVYLLSGTFSNGMIIVDADKSEKVQLVLDGAHITSQTSAAIYVRQAGKVFITLEAGSKNTLANGGSFSDMDENAIGAAVYARDDLTLNGSGALSVASPAGVGIDAKDDLVIAGGSYTVTAAGHGLEANNSIRIAGSKLIVDAGGDALHAEHSDDPALGYVYIESGSLTLTAGGDGVSAGSDMLITGGSFNIVTGGGSANAEMPAGGFMERASFEQPAESADGVSAKGLKAGGSIAIQDGGFLLNTADDSVHANASVHFLGGTVSAKSGDDGFHANDTLSIQGGAVEIPYCYEGLEGSIVEISGGDITVTAMDDGVNAGGGADSSGFGGMGGASDAFSGSSAYASISGGTVYVSSKGDGLDSNGSLYISGGQVIVSGPEGTGNGTLDYDGQGIISGGTFLGTGPASMAQNFGAASSQGIIMSTVEQQPAGTDIALKDSSGRELLSWTADKSFGLVMFSCPEMAVGETYTVTAGSYETSITLDSLVYGAGGGMGGGRGHRFMF